MRRRFPARDRVAARGRDQLKGTGGRRTGGRRSREPPAGGGPRQCRWRSWRVGTGTGGCATLNQPLRGRTGPRARAIGSAEEHCLHTAGVTGSNPVSPTSVVTVQRFLTGLIPARRMGPVLVSAEFRRSRRIRVVLAGMAPLVPPSPCGRAPPAARLRAAPSGPAPPPRPASTRKSRPPFSAPGQGMMINGHGGWMPWPAPCIRPGPNQAAMAGYAILCVTRY